MSGALARRDVAYKLHAELNLLHVLAALGVWRQRMARTSLPFRLQAVTQALPDAAVFPAVLAFAFCLAMGIGYAGLESRWRARAAGAETTVRLHALSSRWDEVRGALSAGLGLVSAVPWLYVALDRACP